MLCQFWFPLILASPLALWKFSCTSVARLHLISDHITVQRVTTMNFLQVRSVWTPALFVENVFWLRSKRAEALLKLLQSLDWSAFLRPGSNLLANICAAEIHPFIFSFGIFPSLPLLSPNMNWFAWVLLRWYHNLYCIVWAYVEWLGRPGLFILRCEVYILPFLPALCLLLHSWLPSLFFLLSER